MADSLVFRALSLSHTRPRSDHKSSSCFQILEINHVLNYSKRSREVKERKENFHTSEHMESSLQSMHLETFKL